MAITYKDINLLTQKAVVAGTEKLPVSDTEFITPDQIVAGVKAEIGDLSAYTKDQYVNVPVSPTTGYYYKFDTLAPYEYELAEYVAIPVQPGEQFNIDGWNWSSNAPLAFVMKSGTTTKARAISQSASGHLSGEYTIPDGYDTLYVNGRTANYPIVVQKKVQVPMTIAEIIADLYSMIGTVESELAEL